MPELPEVETVVREIRPLLCGRRIERITCGRRQLRFAWKSAWKFKVIGRRIDGVSRRGKWLLFDLDDGAGLLGHLGMTGQMRVVPAGQPRELHTHLVFHLEDKLEWRYRDARRFGGIRHFVSAREIIATVLAECLGPEPWDLDPNDWHRRLVGSQRCLKAILLDQTVVAGVGNIYADESLFRARLSPFQLGMQTTKRQAERLRLAIMHVLERAIEARGSSIRSYVGGSGQRGEYQDRLNVYGRPGQPCPACSQPVQRVRLAGRSTHFCPRCQKGCF